MKLKSVQSARKLDKLRGLQVEFDFASPRESTYVISLNIRYVQLAGQVLRNRALSSASGATDDPDVAWRQRLGG